MVEALYDPICSILPESLGFWYVKSCRISMVISMSVDMVLANDIHHAMARSQHCHVSGPPKYPNDGLDPKIKALRASVLGILQVQVLLTLVCGPRVLELPSMNFAFPCKNQGFFYSSIYPSPSRP